MAMIKVYHQLSYYLVIVEQDVEPRLKGPFKSASARDDGAKSEREDDPEMENGIFWLNIDLAGGVAVPEIGSYSGGFFPATVAQPV